MLTAMLRKRGKRESRNASTGRPGNTKKQQHAGPPNARIGWQSRRPDHQGGAATRNARACAGNMKRLPREPTPGSANPVPRPEPRWARQAGSLNNRRLTNARIATDICREICNHRTEYYGDACMMSANRISLLPHLVPDAVTSYVPPQINSVAILLSFTLSSENPKMLGELHGNQNFRYKKYYEKSILTS